MMVIKYIDYKTKKELVTLNTGYIPTKGHILTMDTLPPNPAKYVVYDVQHLVYVPPRANPGELISASVDELKIYIMPLGGNTLKIKNVIGLK